MRLIKFIGKSFFAGFLGGLGALTAFLLASLIAISFFGGQLSNQVSSLIPSSPSQDNHLNLNPDFESPSANTETTNDTNSGNLAPVAPIQPFMGTSVEVFMTTDNDPQAERLDVISVADVSQAYFWVSSGESEPIDFNIYITLPNGSRSNFGPTFTTDPSGQPVNCGQFGNGNPSLGSYRLEIIPIGSDSASGVLEFTITE